LHNDIVTLTVFLIWAFRTLCNLPLDGTVTEGTLFQPSSFLASWAIGMTQKPLYTLEKFRKREALYSRKAMGPPVYRELVNVVFYFSQGFQEIRGAERTLIT